MKGKCPIKPRAEIDILSLQFPSLLGDVKYVIVALDGEWVMSEAGVFTSGRAISTLDDHHIKRTRYDHQVSLVTLYLNQQVAYL